MIRQICGKNYGFSFITNLRRPIKESDPEVYKEILN